MAAFRTAVSGNRLLRFLGVAAVALAGLTCRDRSLTGPGLPQRARLSISPHFAVEAGTPRIRLSKVHIEIFHLPGGEIEKDTVARFVPGDTALSLDLSVTTRFSDEQFRLRLSVYDDATPEQLVYVVDDTVTATPAGVPVATTDVDLVYVGADTIVAVVAAAPRDTVLTVGDNFTFRSTTKRSDSSLVVADVGWASGDTNVVAIDLYSGVARAKAEGANVRIIAATLNGKADTTHVSITQPVGSVVVLPASPSVIQGRTVQLLANVTDTHNVPLPTRPIAWSSANSTIATVGPNGLVTGVALGSTTITATSGGVSGSTTVTVIVPPVFKVIVRPQPDTTMFVGDNFTAGVRLEDDLGGVLTGRSVLWASTSPSVASVDPSTGVVSGIAAGSALISATSEGKMGSTTVNVVRAGTALVVANGTGVFGGSVTLSATLTSRGAPLVGRNVAFSLLGNVVGLAVTDAAGVAQLVNVSLGAIGVGSYPATGTPAGISVAYGGDGALLPASGSAMLTVNRATATLTLGSLSHVYDGTPKQVTVTTSPAGLGTVTVTYAPSGGAPTTTPPSATGSYAVTASLSNPSYQAADATGTMIISAATQTIAFAALSNRAFGEAPFTVNATASSGLPVSFAASGSCAVSGNTVTLTGAGSCTITASQSGNSDYTAAASVSQSFTIAPATATITLGGLSHVYDGTPKSATFTTIPPGLAVVLSYSQGGIAVTAPTDAGSYLVTATVNDPNYTGSANGTMVIAGASQFITYPAIPNHTFGDPPFTLVATASSGLPVTFVLAYGPCSVNGSTVTINGAGTCAINATQPGNANYAPAAAVGQTVTIARATATLALGNLTQTYDGGPKSATVVTNPAGLGVITTTYNGSATAPTDAGSYAVSATISNADYQATPVSGTLTIAPAPTTLTVASASGPFGGTASLSATLSRNGTPVSNGLVTFTLNGNVAGSASTTASGTASIASASLNGIAVGNYPAGVAASFAGDANHLASNGSAPLDVGQGNASVTLGGLSQTYDGTPRMATATTNPAGLSVAITYDGSSTAPTNAGSYAVAATITDSNYTASTATGTLLVSKATATISLGGLAQTYDGTPRVVTATTSPASLDTVSITYDGIATAPTNAGTYAVVASLSNPNFQAANATGTLVVAKGTPTITWYYPADIQYGTALDATQLNATAYFGATSPALVRTDVYVPPLAGTYTYTPPSGTVLNGGTAQTLSVVFTPDDPNLNSASATVLINVLPASQTITFGALSDRLDNEADFAVSATASSSLTVSFAASGGACSMASASVVHLLSAGTCTITASQAGNSNYTAAADVPQSFTVRSAITRTVVSPRSATLTSLNDSLQLGAQSFGDSIPRAGSHSWVSRNPTVASVSASGLVVAQANGVTYVVVTEAGGTKDSSQITVQQQVSTVTVTPGSRTLYYGTQYQLTAAAVDGRGNPISGVLFAWSSTAPAVVSVNEGGLVTTQAATTQSSVVAQVRATAGGVIGVSTITAVTAIQRIAVTPDTLTLTSLGLPQRYSAVAYDTLNAAMSGITFAWQTTNPSVAPLDSATPTTVRAVSAANGVTTIRASAQGVSGSASLKVQQVLASIEVTPAAASVAPTGAISLVARGKDANNRYINGGSFFWRSDSSTIASVNSSTGVVSGVSVGTANITAETGLIISNAARITVTNSVAPAISFGRDTLAVGRGTSTSIPIFLSTPSASPVVVNLAARDTVAFFSAAKVTFPANTTALNVTLNGRNAGTTQVYATDSALVYAGDTAAVAVQATMRLAVGSIYVNDRDQYSTQVLLSDPSPAGGTYVTFAYSTTGIASVSPDPAFIPAGQLAADIVARATAAGTTYITPIASGVNGTATYFDAAPAVLTLSVYTQRLGVGQYEPNNYVYTQRGLTASLPVALTTADTTVARTDAGVTIPANSNYAYFTTRALQTGTARTIATAPGWQPDTFFTTVTTPRLGLCCGSQLNTTSPARTVTVYSEDSVGTGHYRINSLVVSLRSTDTSIIRVLDTTVTIAPGQYYNYNGRLAPAGGVGSAWVVATAGGHFADSSQFTVVGPNLYLSFYTYMLGAGQTGGTYGAYVYTSDAVTTPLTVTLTSADSSKVATTGSVTIPAGQNYAYFEIRGLATTPSAVELTATAAGYTSDAGYVTVTSPRVTSYGGGTLNNFSEPTSFTIYTTDSVGTGHYVSSPVRFTLASSDTSIIRIDSAAITVPVGAYYNYSARVRAVGLGSARIYVIGPAGYINDSSMVYTVVKPRLNLSWYNNYIGLRQTSGGYGAYVYTPNGRPDSVHVSITQKHPERVRLTGADTSIAIPANTNYQYFGYDGIGLGTDTITVSADGYESATAFITVTTPQFTNGGLPSTATTTTPPQSVYVYATDSLGSGHYVMDTVTFRAVSSDSNVIQPESVYFHIAKGQYYKPAGFRFVGPGTASITYSDSAGPYRPTTTNVVNVTGPYLRVSTTSSMLGMRQYEQNYYIYTDNDVTGAPLVVHLLSTDTRVATVPDSLIIPVGLNYAYFRITAQDTVGTIQIQATATGYYAVNTTLQVTKPKFVISTNGSLWTTSPPQGITVYATDAQGNGHYVVDSVPVTLTSSAPSVAAPDSSLVWIAPGQWYNNAARMRPGIVGTTTLTASDSRSAIYSYNPGSAGVAVNLPSVSFSYSSDALGVGQYIEPYVYVPDAVTSPLTVTLTHLGTAKTGIPSSVTIASGYNYASFRMVGSSLGVDSIRATAPGHNADTSFVTVGTGRIDPIAGWPATLRAGVDTVSLTLYTRDQNQNGRYVNDSTTFALSPNANLQFLSFTNKVPITSLTVAPGQYYINFYVTGVSAGTGSATITNALYSLYTPPTITVSP